MQFSTGFAELHELTELIENAFLSGQIDGDSQELAYLQLVQSDFATH